MQFFGNSLSAQSFSANDIFCSLVGLSIKSIHFFGNSLSAQIFSANDIFCSLVSSSILAIKSFGNSLFDMILFIALYFISASSIVSVISIAPFNIELSSLSQDIFSSSNIKSKILCL